MTSPTRAGTLGVLCSFLSLCIASTISSSSSAPCKGRCTRNDVAPVINILFKYPEASNLVCAKVLHRDPVGLVTAQKTTTVGATATFTDTEEVTVKDGVSLFVVSSTSTSTSVDTATVTSSLTAFVTVTTTEDTTVTVTNVVTSPSITVTVTSLTASPVYKRSQGPTLGDTYPGLPKELQDIESGIALPACECFFKAAPVITSTIISTVTERATITIQPSSTTIPSSTSTSTEVIGVVDLLTETATITDYTTLTATEDILMTETATATFTSMPAVTEIAFATVSYAQVPLPRSDCTYNEYYDYRVDIDNNPDNNYQAGVRECEALCTSDPTCKFFFFLHFDPAQARGGDDESACILDNQPYNAAYLQCGYVDNFNVAYNKNP